LGNSHKARNNQEKLSFDLLKEHLKFQVAKEDGSDEKGKAKIIVLLYSFIAS